MCKTTLVSPEKEREGGKGKEQERHKNTLPGYFGDNPPDDANTRSVHIMLYTWVTCTGVSGHQTRFRHFFAA